MNGKKAKSLRRLARQLNGGTEQSGTEIEDLRPAPLLDYLRRLVGQRPRFLLRRTGFRRLYQDLKRMEGYRRCGWRTLTIQEEEKLLR